MNMRDSVQTCLSKYVAFGGTASRSEYWYFVLFNLLLGLVVSFADVRLGTHVPQHVLSFAMLLPSTGAFVRRLHDTGHSGWWYFIALTGVGAFVLLYWACLKGKTYDNKYDDRRGYGRNAFARG